MTSPLLASPVSSVRWGRSGLLRCCCSCLLLCRLLILSEHRKPGDLQATSAFSDLSVSVGYEKRALYTDVATRAECEALCERDVSIYSGIERGLESLTVAK